MCRTSPVNASVATNRAHRNQESISCHIKGKWVRPCGGFSSVKNPILIGVSDKRIGSEARFASIDNAILIGVRYEWVSPRGYFFAIAETIFIDVYDLEVGVCEVLLAVIRKSVSVGIDKDTILEGLFVDRFAVGNQHLPGTLVLRDAVN